MKKTYHSTFHAILAVFLAIVLHDTARAQFVPLGPESAINGVVTGNQQRPAAATSQLGSTVVTWESDGVDGNGMAVMAEIYDATGGVATAQFRVNTSTAKDQRFPDVAIADNGQFAIVWMSDGQDGDGWGIYYAVYTNAGGAILGETIANETTAGQQKFPSIAMSAAGDFVITWENNGEIFARSFDATGIAAGPEYQVNTASNSLQTVPDVASDAHGNFAITWQSTSDDGLDIDIEAQLYSAGGSPVNSEFVVNTTTPENQIEPSIAMDTAGGFTIVWSSYLQDGDGYGVYFQQYNDDGTSNGTETLVNTTTTQNQLHPSAVSTATGLVVVSWTSFDQDGDDAGVYMQLIDRNGGLEGSEILVNSVTEGYQMLSAVATYEDEGPLTVVWQDGGHQEVTLGDGSTITYGDGDGYGVNSRRYDLDAIVEAVAQNIEVTLDASGLATITPEDVDGGSSPGTTLSLDISEFSCDELGENVVTLTATAGNGTTSTATSIVTVIDDIAPTISAVANFNLILDPQGSATLTSQDVVTSTSDNCAVSSVDLSQSIFDCADIGLQTITVTATDESGNEATTTVDVTISDNESPLAQAQDITVALDASGNASITGADVDNGSADNCGTTLSVDPSTFDCSHLGDNNVTLTVTDASGNTSTTTAIVTIIDDLSPIVSAQDISVELDENGTATIDATQVNNGSNDNCSVANISIDVASFDCGDLGVNQVTLTVTDQSGNSASGTAQVTIIDALPPVASTQDIAVALDGSGAAEIIPADVNNGSTDNCGISTFSLDRTSFGCEDIGPQSVTLTVVDLSGNVSTNTATVTVKDDLAPTVIGQPLTVALDDNGQAIVTAQEVDAGSFDNCGIFSIALDQSAFDCSDIGPNTLELTVTDLNGNSASSNVVVTIVDNTAPEIAAQDITVALDANGNASITSADVDNGSSDNCSVVLSLDKTDFSCADIGVNTVTLTATDPSGNTSSTTSTVTVEDNSPPVVSTQNVTIYLDENGNASTTSLDVDNGSTDNCAIASFSLSRENFNCDEVGDNTVTLTVTDAQGNASSATATVTVVDDIPPTITCQDVTIFLDENGEARANVFITGALVSRSDNCGTIGSVGVTGPTVYDCSRLGEHNVRIFQDDVNGNTTICDYTLTVLDNLPPTALTKDITVALDDTGNVSITAAEIDNGSSDNCSVLLSLDRTDFTCADIGANTVTLTATDPSGNSSSTTATVTVEDNVPPVISTQNVTIYLDDNGAASTTAMDVDNGSTDNCGIASFSLSQENFDCDEVGVNTVTLTATDAQGNTSSATATVTVVDDIPPVVVCQDITVFLDENGQVGNNPFLNGALISQSDNCSTVGGVGVTGPRTYDCDDLGDHIVTIIQDDPSGNEGRCSYTITVVDNLLPTVLLTDITVALDDNGHVSITSEDIDNGSSDNCSVVLALDKTDFTCADLGDNIVTVTGTDPSGNTATNTAIVKVVDITPPVLETQDITVELDENGSASISPEYVVTSNDDNCPLSLSLSQTEFNCQDLGANVLTLEAIDASGLATILEVTVTVVDPQIPTVLIQDITLALDDAGTASIVAADIDNGSFDNCDISLSLSETTFDCNNLGDNTVVLTATDESGNVSSTSATVHIVDNTPPVASASDITLEIGSGGAVYIWAGMIDDGSFDNCGIEKSLDVTAFDCSNLGDNIVTLTATDPSGNTSSTTATVTVVDVIAPVVKAQDIVVPLDLNGITSLTPEMVDNGSFDNCSLTLELDRTSFSCGDVGDHTVVLSGTDESGNVASAIATVTIVDDQMPTALAQDLTIELDGTGQAFIYPTDIDGGSTDNCSFSLSISQQSFDCHHLGLNEVILTATDDSGNQSTAVANVVVTDVIAPVAVSRDITVYLDENGSATIAAHDVDAGSTDNCGIVSMDVDIDKFDCSDLGQNSVTLTVTDASGNSSTALAIVTVEDNTPPVIIPQDLTVELDEGGLATITPDMVDNGSFDNCSLSLSLDLTSFSCQDVGSNTVVLTGTDGSGNTSQATSTITIVDNQVPTALSQDITIHLDAAGQATISPMDIDNGSADNCGYELSISQSSFDCDDLGPNEVILTITDEAGNSSTDIATVTVVDDIAPVAIAKDLVISLTENGTANITIEQVDDGSFDNCAIISAALDISSFDCSQLGENIVTLTVYDASGNTHSASSTVTVLDTSAPTVVTQAVTVTLDADGLATVVASAVNNGSFDNCSSVLELSLSKSQFTCEDLGTSVIELFVTDEEGNTGIGQSTVTVLDEIFPTAVTQDFTVALDLETGLAIVTPDDIDNGSDDNCGIVSKSLDKDAFDCSQLGTHQVTLTVTDEAGNSSSATATVTVVIEGEVLPVAICQDITIALDEQGKAEIVAADIDGGSYDICGIRKIKVSKTKFSCKDLGVNEVELTVENFYKNKSTCVARVTVVDDLPPQFSKLPKKIEEFETKEGCSAYVDLSKVKIKAEDNCSKATLSYSPSSGYFDVSEVPYEITVTATDESGNASSATFEILVTKKEPKLKIKKLKAKDNEAEIEGDFDPDEIASIKINWGDGSPNAAPNVKGKKYKADHFYDASGTYEVIVHFTDVCGIAYEQSKKLKVKVKKGKGKEELIVENENTREEITPLGLEISIYPNPFVRDFTIRFRPEHTEKVEVSLFTLDGKKVHEIYSGEVSTEVLYDWSFDRDDLLTSGLYLIKIRGKETDMTRRIIFQKR